MLVLSRPAHNVSIKTGFRVCRLVTRLTGGNGKVVVVSSRVPRLLKVASHVLIVDGNLISKVISAGAAARGRVLHLTSLRLWS